MSDDLKRRIVEILRAYPVAAVSTVAGDRPRSRYLTLGAGDDLILTSATFVHSRKVGEIRANGAVHVLAGFDPAQPNNPWVALEGTAEVLTDDATKRACWVDSLKAYFSDAGDENYAVIRIRPARAEYWTMGSMEPEILTF